MAAWDSFLKSTGGPDDNHAFTSALFCSSKSKFSQISNTSSLEPKLSSVWSNSSWDLINSVVETEPWTAWNISHK